MHVQIRLKLKLCRDDDAMDGIKLWRNNKIVKQQSQQARLLISAFAALDESVS